jgi:2-dehydro-3-deoxyphosphogluconate aldolase/(4S)-4-hydroxy-2-oxoglutarate aldolase
MGSNLFPREIIDSGNYQALAQKSKELIETIKRVRKA